MSNRNNDIQVRIYLSNLDLWNNIRAEYGKFFACAICNYTRQLNLGALLETEATAISKLQPKVFTRYANGT